MFYGAGLVVFSVVLIYTVAVYCIFRGKVHDTCDHRGPAVGLRLLSD